eukprot:3650776-Alexandrium_andersonii.AAC.1
MAVRRNMCNVGTHDLGAVLLDPASHQTVARAEVSAADALVAESHNFHRRMHLELAQRGRPAHAAQ